MKKYKFNLAAFAITLSFSFSLSVFIPFVDIKGETYSVVGLIFEAYSRKAFFYDLLFISFFYSILLLCTCVLLALLLSMLLSITQQRIYNPQCSARKDNVKS